MTKHGYNLIQNLNPSPADLLYVAAEGVNVLVSDILCSVSWFHSNITRSLSGLEAVRPPNVHKVAEA